MTIPIWIFWAMLIGDIFGAILLGWIIWQLSMILRSFGGSCQ